MITIGELSQAYYQAASAFESAQSGDVDSLVRAINLQNTFDEMMADFQKDNPELLLFIDSINKAVTIREPEPEPE